MRCPICGATVNLRLISGDDPDSAEAIETGARRGLWPRTIPLLPRGQKG